MELRKLRVKKSESEKIAKKISGRGRKQRMSEMQKIGTKKF